MYKLKIILITVFLFASNCLNAQRTINWYRILTDTTQLNYNPFNSSNIIKMGYYNINPITGIQHKHVGNGIWVVDSLFKGNSQLIVNGNAIDYSPEQFGAVRANQTFAQLGINQATVDANYPGIGATVNDNIDWAAWQMALKLVSENGGGIKAKGGTYYLGTKNLIIAKYSKDFQLDGNYAKLISAGTTGYIIGRPNPNDNNDANSMVGLRFTIKNLWIKGTAGQTGIHLGPTYGAHYENIHCENLEVGIHLKFALNSYVINCFASDCNIGWIADKGSWAGSTNSNSQSNHSKFLGCRYYTNLNSDAGFIVRASSGVVVENCIVEGISVRAAIDFDAQNSTVVKDFTIRNLHLECINGTTEAAIKIRMPGGIVTIDKIHTGYPNILVDAASTAGYPYIRISNVPWWVLKNGKAFTNVGCNWEFNGNDAFQTNTPSTYIPALFNGTAPQLCTSYPYPGCGSNRFYYISIPR